MIKIGSARISEKGTVNGAKGDQTGKECSVQDYYDHTKGWRTYRAKDPAARERLAYAMAAICKNDHFGYGQADRLSGYNAAKEVGFDPAKVTQDVNIDCSEAVRVCMAYAGIGVGDFYTGSEPAVLEITDAFDEITDLSLLPGDILVTKTKGHTAIVINGDGDWQHLSDGSWCYVDEDGMVKNAWRLINRHWYYFGADGVMLKGWQQLGGEWFYLEESGDYEGACWHEADKRNGSLERWTV